MLGFPILAAVLRQSWKNLESFNPRLFVFEVNEENDFLFFFIFIDYKLHEIQKVIDLVIQIDNEVMGVRITFVDESLNLRGIKELNIFVFAYLVNYLSFNGVAQWLVYGE